MTTKFLDNKIRTFKNLLSWRFPPPPPKKKQCFWTIFLSACNAHPPQKRKFYFYCRLAVSEKRMGARKRTQRTRSPENFQRTRSHEALLDPSKRASVLLCRWFLYRKKTEHWHLRGVENVPYEGGCPKPILGEGCHSRGFPPPSFFHPPHGVLWTNSENGHEQPGLQKPTFCAVCKTVRSCGPHPIPPPQKNSRPQAPCPFYTPPFPEPSPSLPLSLLLLLLLLLLTPPPPNLRITFCWSTTKTFANALIGWIWAFKGGIDWFLVGVGACRFRGVVGGVGWGVCTLHTAPMGRVCLFSISHAGFVENDVSFAHLAKGTKRGFEWP